MFACPLEAQVDLAAIGLNGAGRYRAQCGLVEGGLMFMGVFFAQRGLKTLDIVKICYEFAQSFEQRFGALTCRDLRPGGFQKGDPKHLCQPLTLDTAAFTEDFIRSKM